MKRANKGFLLIAAIILILIIGGLGVYVGHLSTSNLQTSTLGLNASKAESLAEAGLHQGANALLSPLLSDRLTCEEIADTYSEVDFDGGQFSVSGTLYYSTNPATLSNGISSSANIIEVSSLNGYAPYGRVGVDKELIDYTGTSTDDAVCGNEPCLIGAIRGAGGSTAAAHASGIKVGQNQCSITATGAYPSLDNPESEVVLTGQMLSLPEDWIVGQKNSSEDVILRFNGKSWSRMGPYSAVDDQHLQDISTLSYADAWIVAGKKDFYYWTGSEWDKATTVNGKYDNSIPNKQLYGVDCVSGHDCWAVGDDRTLVHYTGSPAKWQYSESDIDTSGNGKIDSKADFRSVSCASSNDCWAVGKVSKGDPLYVHWNGTKWERVDDWVDDPDEDEEAEPGLNNNLLTKDLESVYCASSDKCWSVGTRNGSTPNINHYDGTQWKRVTTSPSNINQNLRDVSCLSETDCWAVGDKSGDSIILRYTGGTWTEVDFGLQDVEPDHENLYGIDCNRSDRCWAVGNNRATFYYDGSTWSDDSSSDISDLDSITRLNKVGAVSIPSSNLSFILAP